MTSSEASPERILVFSDLHGRTALLDEVIDRYGADTTLLSNGDLVGGPDTKSVVQRVLDVGIVALYGNHEWEVDAALHTDDRENLGDLALGSHCKFKSIYPSYGVEGVPDKPDGKTALEALMALRGAINEAGHEAYYDQLRLYHLGATFLAIHAGILPNKPWFGDNSQMSQQKELDAIEDQIITGEFDWSQGAPIQIEDNRTYSLSGNRLHPPSLRARTLVTGHKHLDFSAQDRISSGRKRIALAGPRSVEGPLYVWESWTGLVVPITAR